MSEEKVEKVDKTIYYEGKFMNYEIRDGIIIATYKENVNIDLEAAKVSVQERINLCDGKNYPLMVDGTTVTSVTKEARDYFGSDTGSYLLSASAIYTNSLLATYLANFMIAVNLMKSPIPVKLFTDKKKAIIWLKKFR